MPHLSLPSAQAEACVPGLKPLKPIRRSVRILVIDDDSLVGKALVMLLRSVGHVPVFCSDPETGYAKACTENFDLILTDYDMPGMNGIELAERIKKTMPTPIILMTGASSIRLIEILPDTGISLVLQKPFELTDIDLAIKKLVPYSASLNAVRAILDET